MIRFSPFWSVELMMCDWDSRGGYAGMDRNGPESAGRKGVSLEGRGCPWKEGVPLAGRGQPWQGRFDWVGWACRVFLRKSLVVRCLQNRGRICSRLDHFPPNGRVPWSAWAGGLPVAFSNVKEQRSATSKASVPLHITVVNIFVRELVGEPVKGGGQARGECRPQRVAAAAI
jgi:hypothetical protein